MKRFLAFVLVWAAVIAVAEPRGRYRDWGESPQGFFMTNEERARWRAVRNDSDAAQFVAAFLARRGPSFGADVQKRVAAADGYFMARNLKAMPALRKLVIVFGEPASLVISAPQPRAGAPRTRPSLPHGQPSTAIAGTPSAQPIGSSAIASERLSDPALSPLEVARRRGVSDTAKKVRTFRTYTVTFNGTDGQPRSVILEVDSQTGAERLSKATNTKELDRAVGAIAATTVIHP